MGGERIREVQHNVCQERDDSDEGTEEHKSHRALVVECLIVLLEVLLLLSEM